MYTKACSWQYTWHLLYWSLQHCHIPCSHYFWNSTKIGVLRYDLQPSASSEHWRRTHHQNSQLDTCSKCKMLSVKYSYCTVLSKHSLHILRVPFTKLFLLHSWFPVSWLNSIQIQHWKHLKDKTRFIMQH